VGKENVIVSREKKKGIFKLREGSICCSKVLNEEGVANGEIETTRRGEA